MNVADLVQQLIDAGTPPAVAAVVVTQAFAAGAQSVVSTGSPVDEAAERRRAWDRARKAEKRNSTGNSTGIPPDANRASNLTKDSEIQNEGSLEAQLPLASTGQPAPKSKRGTRLPDDWVPSAADVATARRAGLDEPTIRTEAIKFRNYWTAKTGAAATKLDWSRTWENWCLNLRPGGGAGWRGGPDRPGGGSSGMARVLERLEAEGQQDEPTFDNFAGPTIDAVPDRGEPSDGGPRRLAARPAGE
jgi:Ni/Co efflux regulator RcnB